MTNEILSPCDQISLTIEVQLNMLPGLLAKMVEGRFRCGNAD